MKSYYIKRNIKRLIIALFFCVFLTASFGTILLMNSDCDLNEIRTFIGLIFILISVGMFLIVLNYFSTIKIDQISVSVVSIFKTIKYPIKEFENIKISEIVEYYGFYVDRTTIEMKNKDKLNLYSFKYSNFSELRKFLAILKGENFNRIKIDENKSENKTDIKEYQFNDTHIVSFSGITFYVFTICLFVGFFRSYKTYNISPIICLELLITLLFILFIFTKNLNYFIITNEDLIIKNSIQFWKKDLFKLKNIQSIEIYEYNGQPGKSIVIKTYDYKVKEYVSENLWSKTWIDFKRIVGNNNIIVKDKSKLISRKILY